MNQEEIGNALGISQVSVSHYMNDKRGDAIEFNHETKQMIYNLAHDLKNGYISKKDISCRICYICTELKNDSIIRKFCTIGDDNMKVN